MKCNHCSACLVLVTVFALACVPLPALNSEALRLINADAPNAFQLFENTSPDHELPSTQDLAMKGWRKPPSDSWERSRERSLDHALIRDLFHQPPIIPGFASKLDLCSEFTKPDSLLIRSMGTPKNHRSPPA